jgi:hypothetical protein
MSVPLHNLYHWVESLIPDPVVLYVFHPYGSKKISNCNFFRLYDQTLFRNLRNFPAGIIHDQEPLDWDFYNSPQQYLDHWKTDDVSPFDKLRFEYISRFNLKSIVFFVSTNPYDRTILIHSEKNSRDLDQYQQNGFECVHYWAHAIIARDWYRFAQIDTRLKLSLPPKKTFLIYCRDWSHRREYRLKFLEMLVQNNLHEISQTTVMHTNTENVHFTQHQFANPAFELVSLDLINCISNNTFPSTASAEYDFEDFVNSEISVVLETVFDDSKIHLTEKTLRPIACGHPFLLAAGPGSLEYIRSYGFKTFAPLIDESYDQELNSLKRLEKIIRSMKQIQNLTASEKKELKIIANYNKEHFFSDNFFNLVQSELKTNLEHACEAVKRTKGKYYLEFLKFLKKQQVEFPLELRLEKTRLVRRLRQSYPHDRSNPATDPVV